MKSNLSNKNIYLASDFHLGVPDEKTSLLREKEIISWLNDIENDAKEIYLLGDIFDFWFEYKRVVPKGFVRLQGKIASITDKGIPVHVFTGNHDMWIFDYLPKELGITLHRNPLEKTFFGKKYLIGHGDGLGPGDKSYKFLKIIFQNSMSKWLFARLHPNFGLWLAQKSSTSSRNINANEDALFKSKEHELLYHFCKDHCQNNNCDYYIFGHRHLPLKINIKHGVEYLNLGEWLTYNTFIKITPENTALMQYKNGSMKAYENPLG